MARLSSQRVRHKREIPGTASADTARIWIREPGVSWRADLGNSPEFGQLDYV